MEKPKPNWRCGARAGNRNAVKPGLADLREVQAMVRALRRRAREVRRRMLEAADARR